MTFGEVAVDGFFLISGFLITQSFVGSVSTAAYLERRMARIIPGYAVAFLVCVLLVAPLAGNSVTPSTGDIATSLLQMLTLSPPGVPGVFIGLPYPLLNGAMWTIAYEFRCYLLVAVLGLMGAYRSEYRALLAAGVGILLVLNASGAMLGVHTRYDLLLGEPAATTRLSAVFGVGMMYYLFRERISITNTGAALATILLAGAMCRWHLAETGFAIFGGYLIFYLAFKCPMFRVSCLTNKSDISYGLYLYGWPIQTIIIWNDRAINPWLLCCLCLAAASIVGYASWTWVEKPCMNLARVRRTRLVLS